MEHAYIIEEITPGRFRTVAAFSTTIISWCAYESHTSYKPTTAHIMDLQYFGRPLTLEEVDNAFSVSAGLKSFVKDAPGIYWQEPDAIIVTALSLNQ
jgi:hypothetical protein